ncbi:MAG: hypothetical protein JWP01_4111 [Myxococcales bacterium]|nr:hypothetical protein [Myxococcales bacterium]
MTRRYVPIVTLLTAGMVRAEPDSELRPGACWRPTLWSARGPVVSRNANDAIHRRHADLHWRGTCSRVRDVPCECNERLTIESERTK